MKGCISKQSTNVLFVIGILFIVLSSAFIIIEYTSENVKTWKITAAVFATLAAFTIPHSAYGYRCSGNLALAGTRDVLDIVAIALLIISLVKK